MEAIEAGTWTVIPKCFPKFSSVVCFRCLFSVSFYIYLNLNSLIFFSTFTITKKNIILVSHQLLNFIIAIYICLVEVNLIAKILNYDQFW